MGIIVETLLVIGLILFTLIAIAVLVVLIYSVILWRRNRSLDDTQQTVKAMQKDIQKIKIKLDIQDVGDENEL